MQKRTQHIIEMREKGVRFDQLQFLAHPSPPIFLCGVQFLQYKPQLPC